MKMRRAALLLLVAIGSLAATPAPAPSASTAPTHRCAHLDAPVPARLVDLAVTEENVCADLSQTQRLLAVSALTLYSVRRADQVLVATLEIARLKPEFNPAAPAVQGTITAQIGDTAPERLEVGGTIVYATQARGLTLLTWFRKKDVYVLAVRDIFDRPRTMLREALEGSR